MGLKLRENELLLKQQIEVIRELGKMRLVSLESVQLTRSMHAAAVALGPWNDLYVWGSRWEGGNENNTYRHRHRRTPQGDLNRHELATNLLNLQGLWRGLWR